MAVKTGATKQQIKDAVFRAIPETMNWEYSAGHAVLMSVNESASLLVTEHERIVSLDDLKHVVRLLGLIDDHNVTNDDVDLYGRIDALIAGGNT